jgi:hypothetical protein
MSREERATLDTPPLLSSRYDTDESDNGSLFQFVGDRGDGRTSVLCHNCQWIADNWSRYIEDSKFTFPHYGDTFQLEDSAMNGCALCYQFWRNGSDCVQEARREMDNLGRSKYVSTGVVTIGPNALCQMRDDSILSMSLTLLRQPDNELENSLHDVSIVSSGDRSNEIASFTVSLIPALSSGEPYAILWLQ